MLISEAKCVACGNCIPICPVGAIHIDPKKNRATVNQDECVECYTCFRGMSVEHLNPWMVRTIRGALKLLRLRFEPEPDVWNIEFTHTHGHTHGAPGLFGFAPQSRFRVYVDNITVKLND